MNPYDRMIWQLTIWREARGESQQAKTAIAAVIRNRVLDSRWPNTLAEVCLQPKQFSCYNAGDPNSLKFPSSGNPDFIECGEAIDQVLLGADPSRGANHYHHLPLSRLPKWADEAKLTVVLGTGRFYKL